MPDELAEHLNALERDDCYRVESVLKSSPIETTELVSFEGENGSRLGPFVRKRIARETGLGTAYEALFQAQRAGRRFLYLPRLVDCHIAGEELVVVMEFVGGETLQDAVYRCEPSLALAADVFPRLCDAVCELHEGFSPALIHRDLKPTNIMLSQSSLTIIDFGIARTYRADAEEDTRRFGTRGYAPPEQFGFGQTDVRSDVYALGLVLWFCLTERTPDARVRAEGYADERVPEPLRAVILRATAFNPADRYPSVRALKAAFEAALVATGAGKAVLRPSMAPQPVAQPIRQPVPQPVQKPSRHSVSQPLRVMGQGGSSLMPRKGILDRLSPQARYVIHGLGIVWDVVLALLALLFIVLVTVATFDPAETSVTYNIPIAQRAATNYSILICIFLPVFYLVSYKPTLRKFVPFLAKSKWWIDLLSVLAIEVCGLFLVGFFQMFK